MAHVVGDHLLCDSNTLVFTHIWRGTTYVVAAQIEDAIIVHRLALTGANATIVVQAAINALRAGRTGKAKVTIKGDYIDLGQISLPDYTEAEIIGKLTAQNTLNTSFIVNSDQTDGNTEIEIHGGHVDANRANQTANMSTIYFVKCTYTWVHHMKVAGGFRDDGRGEGIEFDQCLHGQIHHNEVYSSAYDNIKLLTSDHCVVISNTCREGDLGQIQLAYSEDNIVADNRCFNTSEESRSILIAHEGADNNIIIGNLVNTSTYGIAVNSVDGVCYNNHIIGNFILACVRGIYLYGADTCQETFITGNYLRGCATAIRLDYADRSWITTNYIIHEMYAGTGIAIMIGANCDDNRFGPHYIYDMTTIVSDAGVNTQFPQITAVFTWYSGATMTVYGILVNADGEIAGTALLMPPDCHAAIRVRIYARAIDATANAMRGEIRTVFGADNEAWSAHNDTIADLPSATTNFAADDIIYWERSSATITLMTAGDSVSIRFLGEAAGDGDIATNAQIRTATIEYI